MDESEEFWFFTPVYKTTNTKADENTKIEISGMRVTDANFAPYYCCCQYVVQDLQAETFSTDIYDVRALNRSIKNLSNRVH